MNTIKVSKTGIEGLVIIEPTVYKDSRGYFMETYNEKGFKEAGIDAEFVQDNQSYSTKGVLRGLHFQFRFPQGKLVRVLKGKVFDAAVDLRRNSASYGKWYGLMLTEKDNKMIYIPEGFAHGFLVISNTAEIAYKCTDYYYPEDEGGIIWNDSCIGIKWPEDSIEEVKLSEKDRNLKGLKEIEGMLEF